MTEAGHWNYRVMARRDGMYVIVEAYYDGVGQLIGYTDETWPLGENTAELQSDLDEMRQAFFRPILHEPGED